MRCFWDNPLVEEGLSKQGWTTRCVPAVVSEPVLLMSPCSFSVVAGVSANNVSFLSFMSLFLLLVSSLCHSDQVSGIAELVVLVGILVLTLILRE